jgi:hypothetical protein
MLHFTRTIYAESLARHAGLWYLPNFIHAVHSSALDSLTVPELRGLKHGLGLKGTTLTRTVLLAVLEKCLYQK